MPEHHVDTLSNLMNLVLEEYQKTSSYGNIIEEVNKKYHGIKKNPGTYTNDLYSINQECAVDPNILQAIEKDEFPLYEEVKRVLLNMMNQNIQDTVLQINYKKTCYEKNFIEENLVYTQQRLLELEKCMLSTSTNFQVQPTTKEIYKHITKKIEEYETIAKNALEQLIQEQMHREIDQIKSSMIIKSLNERLDFSKERIIQKDKEIDRCEKDIFKKREELQSTMTLLTHKKNEVELLNIQLNQKVTYITKLECDISDLNLQHNSLAVSIENMKHDNELLKLTIQEKEGEISGLNESITELHQKIVTDSNIIEQCNKSIKSLKFDITKMSSELMLIEDNNELLTNRLNTINEEHKMVIIKNEKDYWESQKQNLTLKEENTLLSKQIEFKQQKIDELTNFIDYQKTTHKFTVKQLQCDEKSLYDQLLKADNEISLLKKKMEQKYTEMYHKDLKIDEYQRRMRISHELSVMRAVKITHYPRRTRLGPVLPQISINHKGITHNLSRSKNIPISHIEIQPPKFLCKVAQPSVFLPADCTVSSPSNHSEVILTKLLNRN